MKCLADKIIKIKLNGLQYEVSQNPNDSRFEVYEKLGGELHLHKDFRSIESAIKWIKKISKGAK